jgi:hypothetical protein
MGLSLGLIIILRIPLYHSVPPYGIHLPPRKCITITEPCHVIHTAGELVGHHGIMSFPQTGMELNASPSDLEFKTAIQALLVHIRQAIPIVCVLRLGPAGIINMRVK